MQELKPCPFCGQQPRVTKTKGWKNAMPARYGVLCADCAICLGWSDTEAEAVERWNTRKGEAQ